jgi:hypothetical protein
MNIGMLWFDNDPKAEVNTKIERAAAYYQNKYGKSPDLVFVHPSMMAPDASAEGGMSQPSGEASAPAEKPEKPLKNGTIEVRTSRSVLPNHFWIGVNGTVTPTES